MVSGTVRRDDDVAYWYDASDPDTGAAMDVLEAVRRFRLADRAMRHRLQGDMLMGETDLAALRHLIVAEKEHRPIGPTQLARLLDISTAATAKLLARLVASGHILREPHPTDRRAQVLRAAPEAHDEVRKTLGVMHERMLHVAEGFDRSDQQVVIAFLDAMSDAVESTIRHT